MAVEGWVLWGQPGPQRPCLARKAFGVCVRGWAGLEGVWEGGAPRAWVQREAAFLVGGGKAGRRLPALGARCGLPLMGSTPVLI